MFKLSEERRYQLERAKDNTPSTSVFIWFIPCFFILAMICRDDTHVSERHLVSMPETRLTILGWEIL